MTKILLVEDDKSLREIYGVRLLAEGYDVVSASDGEQALAMAIKERPALIITDVMMPKISGFDMLDILRSTTETREIKVIVMTALGSDENKDRGERLGADAYLVKSQVGIEDVVRKVHDLLGDAPAMASAPGAAPAMPAAPATAMPTATRTAPPTPVVQRPAVPMPTAPAPTPTLQPTIPTPPPATPMPTPPPRNMVSSPAIPQPGTTPAASMTLPPQPVGAATPPPIAPTPPSAKPADPPSRRTRIIQPLNNPDKKVNLQDLVERELAKEGGDAKLATADEERQVMNDQINDFIKSPATPPAAEVSQLPPVNQPTQPPAAAPIDQPPVPPLTSPSAPSAVPAPPTSNTPSTPTWPTPPTNPTA
jgi:CheY-like chemotaxis protein